MTRQKEQRRTLRAIAAIALPGEPITDPFWRNEMVERGEYDESRDCFMPKFGTVAAYLEFAVMKARKALKAD